MLSLPLTLLPPLALSLRSCILFLPPSVPAGAHSLPSSFPPHAPLYSGPFRAFLHTPIPSRRPILFTLYPYAPRPSAPAFSRPILTLIISPDPFLRSRVLSLPPSLRSLHSLDLSLRSALPSLPPTVRTRRKKMKESLCKWDSEQMLSRESKRACYMWSLGIGSLVFIEADPTVWRLLNLCTLLLCSYVRMFLFSTFPLLRPTRRVYTCGFLGFSISLS